MSSQLPGVRVPLTAHGGNIVVFLVILAVMLGVMLWRRHAADARSRKSASADPERTRTDGDKSTER